MRLPVDFIIQLQMFICSIFRIDQVQALGRFSENWFVVGSRCRFISRCHLLFHIFVQNQIQKGAVNKINNFLDSFSIFFKNNITDAVNDPFFMFCEPGNDKICPILSQNMSHLSRLLKLGHVICLFHLTCVTMSISFALQ